MFKGAESDPRFESFDTELASFGLSEFNNEPEGPRKEISFPTPRRQRGFWCQLFPTANTAAACPCALRLGEEWTNLGVRAMFPLLTSGCEVSGGGRVPLGLRPLGVGATLFLWQSTHLVLWRLGKGPTHGWLACWQNLFRNSPYWLYQ